MYEDLILSLRLLGLGKHVYMTLAGGSEVRHRGFNLRHSARESLPACDVRRQLTLAFLAPAIVKAILAGHQLGRRTKPVERPKLPAKGAIYAAIGDFRECAGLGGGGRGHWRTRLTVNSLQTGN